MPYVTENVPAIFVGDFKVGDNLVYNCALLSQICEGNGDGRFNKLIVVQSGTICEAALSQIIYRAQNFNREGVPNINATDQAEIAGKKIDKFNNVINVLQKYHVLDAMGANIYTNLHRLRRHRNKVHIQDDVEGSSRDEDRLFTGAFAHWALNLNSDVLKFLADSMARPKSVEGYVQDLRVTRWQAMALP